MTALSATRLVNRLLNDLPRKEHDRIRERCESVELAFGTILCEPDEPFDHVYFPLSGFISLVELVGNHQPLEMGLIGSEGMLGATMALGVYKAPLRAVVQGAGTALRMPATEFDRELRNTPVLLSTMGRYLYILMAQLAQTAACTCFHEVEARLARWLLMTHDRAHANHFHLTHKFLADMLGVQRSAVTIAAGTLQKRMLIHYTRGEINIINRKGLEAASCECYVAVTEDYTRLFP
ncbi:MAG TPA: Crp/Fnr family transcriptional regulator [Pseudomonadales bacterium]|nr:Crp/Fnr family transcriptional regulator [Pseudomonadales bacterium]